MWGFGNLKTGEVAVVLSMDLGDTSTTKTMYEDFAEIIVDEVLEPGYEELDVSKMKLKDKDDVVPDNAQCRYFEGTSDALDGDVVLIMCMEDTNIFVISGDVDSDILWGLVDDMISEGEPKVPDGFTDLTEQLN